MYVCLLLSLLCVCVCVCVCFGNNKNKHAITVMGGGSNTVLMESCAAGYDDIIAEIMQKCDINLNDKDIRGIGPLEIATINGSLKCVQLLLKNQSNYSACAAITYACGKGHFNKLGKQNIPILKALIEYEKKNNRRQFPPSAWAVTPEEMEPKNAKEYFTLLLNHQAS